MYPDSLNHDSEPGVRSEAERYALLLSQHRANERRKTFNVILTCVIVLGAIVWVVAMCTGCTSAKAWLPASANDVDNVQNGIDAKLEAFTKKTNQTLGDHARLIQRNGTSDIALVTIIIVYAVSALGVAYMLIRYEKSVRQALCRYPGCPPTDESVADLPPRGEMDV